MSSRDTDNILKFHGATGQFLGRFNPGAVLNEPSGLTFGPDGHLYVAGIWSSNVVRYDGRTGAFIDVFAQGGIVRAIGLQFGPNGDLYVVSQGNDRVLRFDGRSGAPLGVFAEGNGGTDFTWMIFRPARDPAAIFSDGFERGEFSRWTQLVR